MHISYIYIIHNDKIFRAEGIGLTTEMPLWKIFPEGD